MKELAKLKIRKVDQRINQMPSDELDEKIDLIYSLGYVYNPYIKEFYNIFINQSLKAIVVYNLDLNRIQNLHESLEKEYLEKNKKIRTHEEIEKNLYENNTGSSLFIFLSSESIIVFFILLISSIVAHIVGGIKIAAITSTVSFFLINCFIFYNLLYAKYENDFMLGQLWKNYQNIFLILSFLIYPYLYYLLYISFDSFWIPIIIIFPLRYIAKKYITKELSNRYWISSIMELIPIR